MMALLKTEALLRAILIDDNNENITVTTDSETDQPSSAEWEGKIMRMKKGYPIAHCVFSSHYQEGEADESSCQKC